MSTTKDDAFLNADHQGYRVLVFSPEGLRVADYLIGTKNQNGMDAYDIENPIKGAELVADIRTTIKLHDYNIRAKKGKPDGKTTG